MLATFSSFLPSSLSFSQDKDKERPTLSRHNLSSNNSNIQNKGDQDTTYDQGRVKEKDMFTNDEGVIKRRKEKHINETFIVVRPPPAVSNHPLNLQLQLVPPSQKDPIRSSRPSIDFDSSQQTEDNTSRNNLNRSLSTRSNRSDVSASIYSSLSSIQSVSSFASGFSTSTTSTTSSGGGGRRTIIPLYNLHAHNVMTNTICDAGTDAKVVKFHKRGMEVLGFAVLEPVEVWSYKHSDEGPSRNNSSRGNHTPTVQQQQQRQQPTPTSSVNSLSISSGVGHETTPTSSRSPNYPYMHGSASSAAGSSPLKGRRQAMSVGFEQAGPYNRSSSPSSNMNGVGGQQQQPGSPAKKIFGKLFKRRENMLSAGAGLSTPSSEFGGYTPSIGSSDINSMRGTPSGNVSGHSRSVSHPANFYSSSVEKSNSNSNSNNTSVLPTILSSGSSMGVIGGGGEKDVERRVRNQGQGHGRTLSRSGGGGGGGGGNNPSVNVSPPVDDVVSYQQQQILLPPVLGIQPIFVSANGNGNGNGNMSVVNPLNVGDGRPTRYVWFLQKWIKSPGVAGSSGVGGGEDASAGAGTGAGAGVSGAGGRLRAFLSGGVNGEKSKHNIGDGIGGDENVSESGRSRRIGINIGGITVGGGGEYIGETEVRIEWIRAQKVRKRRSVVNVSGGNASRTSLPNTNSNVDGSGSGVERRGSILVKRRSVDRDVDDRDRDGNGLVRSNTGSVSSSRGKRVSMSSSSQRESSGSNSTTVNDSSENVAGGAGGVVDEHGKMGSLGRKRKGAAGGNDPYGFAKGKAIGGSGSRVQIVLPDEHLQNQNQNQQQQEGGEIDDAGEESDPEDSETPWNCVITLMPRVSTGAGTSGGIGAGGGGGKGIGLGLLNVNGGHGGGGGGARPISIASFDSGLQQQLQQQQQQQHRGQIQTLAQMQVQGLSPKQAQAQLSPVDSVNSPSAKSTTTSSSKTPTNSPPTQRNDNDNDISTSKSSPHSQSHAHAHAHAQQHPHPQSAHPIRLKIASLSPAPHHPKIVAQLKVAFPLPDIDIDSMRVRKRAITPGGQLVRQPVESGYRGMTMTAEELKDVLCSTALWLVVREGFGGVGNVKRKGDGWKIRG